jgi:hypothetical protein
MKSNELRIGNYYNLVEDGVNIDDIYQIDDGYSLYLIDKHNNAKGIPLTEEWLKKFGFDGWDIGNYTMILTNGNFFEFGNIIAQNIKYVHQLQNLYFALTNEELTIIENDKNKD